MIELPVLWHSAVRQRTDTAQLLPENTDTVSALPLIAVLFQQPRVPQRLGITHHAPLTSHYILPMRCLQLILRQIQIDLCR